METIPVIANMQAYTEASWTGMKVIPSSQLMRFPNQSAMVSECLLQQRTNPGKLYC